MGNLKSIIKAAKFSKGTSKKFLKDVNYCEQRLGKKDFGLIFFTNDDDFHTAAFRLRKKAKL